MADRLPKLPLTLPPGEEEREAQALFSRAEEVLEMQAAFLRLEGSLMRHVQAERGAVSRLWEAWANRVRGTFRLPEGVELEFRRDELTGEIIIGRKDPDA